MRCPATTREPDRHGRSLPVAAGERLLEVNGLETHFFTRQGLVKAVDGVSFHVNRGEVLGLVGESGCGKSVTSLSIMGLVPDPGKVVSGGIPFGGKDITNMKAADGRALRGEHISMIFQQPDFCPEPGLSGRRADQGGLRDPPRLERRSRGREGIEMLAKVGIPDPRRRAESYPHELSGGMAQRIMIAMALAREPELLIADEPTTALDVTIQAQILDLILDLHEDSNTAVILITHDLGIVAEMADRVSVMYAGEIVEETDVRTLFRNPHHPYTKG